MKFKAQSSTLKKISELPAPSRHGLRGPAWSGTRFLALGLFLLLFCAFTARAESPAAAFDQANKLYEQNKFVEAAAAYEKLIQSGHGSATVRFNLGNARFKAGQNGRALAAWRDAEQLSPRDPDVRANLRFVRRKVTGSETAARSFWWQRFTALTLNEWTVLAAGAFWIWFALLALREFRPAWRKTLSGYTATAGMAALLLGAGLAAAAYARTRVTEAVVIEPQAVVRYGPLDESQVAFQLRDGSEVIVLDAKIIAVGDRKQTWLEVREAAGRAGWIKRDQVVILE